MMLYKEGLLKSVKIVMDSKLITKSIVHCKIKMEWKKIDFEENNFNNMNIRMKRIENSLAGLTEN